MTMADSTSYTEYTPHSHLPYGAEGSGHFTKAARHTSDSIKAATSLSFEAIDKVSFKSDDGAFVICDYGAADGGTSMFFIRAIIDKVQQKYGAEQQVHVIYEDQPVNDFKSLLLRMHGFIPDPPSYLIDHKNVFVTCCGTNFYSQCFPDNSVHFGFSAIATQWLSKRPCNISGGGIMHTFIKDEEEKRLFAQQASRDWETFLLHRAKEMKPGGRMIIVSLALDEEGQHTGNTNNRQYNLFERLGYHWKTMVQDGLITQEEFNSAGLNIYYRTEAEHLAPFRDDQSVVSLAGVKLVSMEIKQIHCALLQLWLQQGNSEDGLTAEEFAHLVIECMRSWGNYTFFSALDEDRPEEERRALIDDFFQRCQNEVVKNQNYFVTDMVSAYIHITKRL